MNRWSVLVLIIGSFIGLPIFIVAYQLLKGPGEEWEHITTFLLPHYVYHTFFLIVCCAIGTLLIGVGCAWLICRYEFPFRRVLDWMLILPLAIPSFITAYAYAGVFDNGGTWTLMMAKLGIEVQKIDVMNLSGLCWVLSISLFPYVYIGARAAFRQHAQQFREASHLLGATERKFFFTIALPLARPAIISGLLFVIMEVLNDYGAAKYYGINTFTTGIFNSWRDLEDLPSAFYLSAILVLLIFVLILLERWQRGSRSYATVAASDGGSKRILLSGGKAWFVCLLTVFPLLAGFVLPVAQLLYWVYYTFWDVLDVAFIQLIINSFFIAFLAALLTTILALFFVYFSKWTHLSGVRLFARTASLGYIIPGAVIGLGVLISARMLVQGTASLFDLRIGFLLYGSMLTLVYAYVVRFFAIAHQTIEASSAKIGSQFFESAILLGKKPILALKQIDFPLLKTGLLSAMTLLFIDIMKELPLTLVLKSPDVQTLAIKAYEYIENGDQIDKAALPSLLIIGAVSCFILISNRWLKT
ncbi:MAG: iron ABC transporter permease [Bacteroidota bacterium]